jgi:hypothetical protein
MRLMLVKETGGRKLRCMDCGQPDPMRSAETRGMAQRRTRHSEVEAAEGAGPSLGGAPQFWNYPLQGLLVHEDRITS